VDEITIHPAAEAEYEEALGWYLNASPGWVCNSPKPGAIAFVDTHKLKSLTASIDQWILF